MEEGIMKGWIQLVDENDKRVCIKVDSIISFGSLGSGGGINNKSTYFYVEVQLGPNTRKIRVRSNYDDIKEAIQYAF
jgi:hypothetical protein